MIYRLPPLFAYAQTLSSVDKLKIIQGKICLTSKKVFIRSRLTQPQFIPLRAKEGFKMKKPLLKFLLLGTREQM